MSTIVSWICATSRGLIPQFCLRHRDLFPPFHCPFRPAVEISNPSLATTTFNYKRWLPEWHPFPSLSCQCQSLLGKTTSGHTLARASDVASTILALRNLSDTTWPTEESFFAHVSSQFDRWLQARGLGEAFLDGWNVFLMQQ